MHLVVLVEGESDRRALLSTAEANGRDLEADGVGVIAMGGATNVETYARRFGRGGEVDLIGLCDAAEVRFFERVLDGDDIFVCDPDLEHELIAALGEEGMLDFIEDQGELKTFRTFQKQPAQRGRSIDEHFHRFFGTRARRKIRYAGEIASILAPDRTPPPLRQVLSAI